MINQLCQFFDDAGTTYTKLLETMNDARTEIGMIQDRALRYAEKDTAPCNFEMEHVNEFFFQMQMLLWDLKPIAIDMERGLQDRGSKFVGYSVEERAAK